MSAATEGRGSNSRSWAGVNSPRQAAELEADGLQRSAELAEAEQSAILEASSVESDYMSALASMVEAKHGQVERLEGRLEGVIEQQEAKLHRIEANRPGLLSKPGRRAGWQGQLEQQQALIQKLHGRLEVVREVKESMGLYGSKVEELAARKLRFHQRELASEWDQFRVAQRGHQELLRQKEKKEKERQGLDRQSGDEPDAGFRNSLSLRCK